VVSFRDSLYMKQCLVSVPETPLIPDTDLIAPPPQLEIKRPGGQGSRKERKSKKMQPEARRGVTGYYQGPFPQIGVYAGGPSD
jgi:hypothetical protein